MLDYIRAEPLWLQAWIYWMMLINLAAFGFLRRVEARWTLAAFFAAALVMNVLFEQLGYVRLLGLAHVLFWTPLVVYLYRRRTEIRRTGGLFRGWATALLATISVSLVIDVVDVVRYLAGDRG